MLKIQIYALDGTSIEINRNLYYNHTYIPQYNIILLRVGYEEGGIDYYLCHTFYVYSLLDNKRLDSACKKTDNRPDIYMADLLFNYINDIDSSILLPDNTIPILNSKKYLIGFREVNVDINQYCMVNILSKAEVKAEKLKRMPGKKFMIGYTLKRMEDTFEALEEKVDDIEEAKVVIESYINKNFVKKFTKLEENITDTKPKNVAHMLDVVDSVTRFLLIDWRKV